MAWRLGISIQEVPFSGSMGRLQGLKVLKGVKPVCEKRIIFLQIKSTPIRQSCLPFWVLSVWRRWES